MSGRWRASDPDPEDEAPRRSMMPRERGRLRVGHPPQAIPLRSEEPEEDEDAESRSTRQDLDPVFGFVMAMALSVGLTPLDDNLRYVALWAVLALMGGAAVVLGSGIRFRVTDPGDLVWGIGLGAFSAGAILLVGYDTLKTVSERLFSDGDPQNPLFPTWVFMAAVFAMPTGETLFFRGAMQRAHPIPVVAVLASAWAGLLFFPNLGLGDTPVVGVVFGTALVLLNFLYSYVHWRHGLAASFFCQVVAGSLLLLAPVLIAQ